MHAHLVVCGAALQVLEPVRHGVALQQALHAGAGPAGAQEHHRVVVEACVAAGRDSERRATLCVNAGQQVT
jgi:hypothetical protein